MSPAYEPNRLPSMFCEAPASRAAAVSLSMTTFSGFSHPRLHRASEREAPTKEPITSFAFISLEKLITCPSFSGVIFIAYEKQKPIFADLPLRCSKYEAIVSKNSFLEYSRSMPGIERLSKFSIEGRPSLSNCTEHERKLVPPASITITVSFFGTHSGGFVHVGIICCEACGKLSCGQSKPSCISYSSASMTPLISGPFTLMPYRAAKAASRS